MISRRNIRVKVMQTLYTLETQSEDVMNGNLSKPGAPLRLLNAHFDDSNKLFLFLVHSLVEICRYAETDARQRASKYLPSAEDLNVNTKLAGNEWIWKLIESPSYQQAVAELKPDLLLPADFIKKLYYELTDKALYKEYIETPSRDPKKEKEIIHYIFAEVMLPSPLLETAVEDQFNNWLDDGDMMITNMQKLIQKPHQVNFQQFIDPEKLQYAKSLLKAVIDKEDYLMDLIKPKLKNWEADRIAVLDLIIIKMGVVEFLYFDTIPTNVTINEYIDLAKEYSTSSSGQFTNGILDNIKKDLLAKNLINKVDFKGK